MLDIDKIREYDKWRIFFSILRRKYVYIPLSIFFTYAVDSREINIHNLLVSLISHL